MIPRKIQIKNFLSYGDDLQTIDFSTYRLICLSGKNGHGKSALLDAMTWALWGQARESSGISKADEGLLRLGQDTMVVIFDFELNSTLYRIRREYIHTYGKPYTGLEFGILDPANDTFKPLTDKTIRDTQQRIEQVIKLNFDSFINSAFLRQGQSNEFSKKSPKERKDILAAILGLNEYDTVRKRAMEKIKTATQEKNTLTTLQATLALELAQAETVAAELQGLEHKLRIIEATRAQLATEKQMLEQHSVELAHQQQQAALLQYKYTQYEQERETLRTTLRATVTTWRAVHARSKNPLNYHTLSAHKKEIADQLQASAQALHAQLQLKEQALQLKEAVQTIERTYLHHHESQLQQTRIANERLQSDLINYTSTLTTLTQQTQELAHQMATIAQELTALETLCAHSTAQLASYDTYEQQFIKRKAYYQKYITHGNWLSSQLHTLASKTSTILGQEKASCPLCEQIVSLERHQFLQHKADAQRAFINHQLTRITHVIAQLKTLLCTQHEQLTQLKKEQELQLQRQAHKEALVKQHAHMQPTHAQLAARIVECQKHIRATQELLRQQDAQLSLLEEQKKRGIGTDELYSQALLKQAAVQQSLTQIQYDATKHSALQQQLAHIEQQMAHHEQLTHESSLQATRKTEIHTICTQLKKLQKSLHTLRQELDQYATLDATSAQLKQALTTHQTQEQTLTTQQHQLLQLKGRVENRLATLTQYQATHTKNQALIRVVEEAATDYQHIAAATGKDGIQALLIEDAIPEIEQEANELLAKLTNNQAHLSIESLRDLKKGGTKETLDIKISDAAGIRAYELFSGGEAFRIDFALRIAISKLLARRAGTALQTLIIDEGFGSQDDEGLTHIMDAMYKIQDDFQKIIIVSHLPAMKDQFPVHFVVEKKPSGSKVTVIEQD